MSVTKIEREKNRTEIVEEIRERFPKVKFPTPVLEPIYYGRFDKKPVSDRLLVLDADTGTQFDIVSTEYQLVWHEETVKLVLESCPEEYGTPEFTIRVLNNGATCSVAAYFPELGDYKINGSALNPGIKILNSINRTKQLEFLFGAMELVCTNGLMRWNPKTKQKFKHMYDTLDKKFVGNEIKNSLDDFSEQHKIWEKWAKTTLELDQVLEFIAVLPYSEREAENLLEIPLMNHEDLSIKDLLEKRKATLWSAYSAATQYARHSIRSELRSETIEAELGNNAHVYAAKFV